LVYHGSTAEAEEYFSKHNYVLPKGESIADWLIDISSGRLGPSKEESDKKRQNEQLSLRGVQATLEEVSEESESGRGPVDLDDSEAMDKVEMPAKEESAKVYDVDEMIENQSQSNIASMQSLLQSTTFDAAGGEGLQDEAALAKIRREVLYTKWQDHFKSLSDSKKALYEAPTPYDLPAKVEKIAFPRQLGYQLARCVIVGQRNWTTKVIDTFIVVGATVLVSAMDGTEEPTSGGTLFEVKYEKIAEPTRLMDLLTEFPNLFKYALSANVRNIQMYAAKLSVLLAVLTALSGGKVLASKRKEFFREAASGYNVNAYMGAVNIIVTIEVAVQCAISGVVAIWLRNNLAKWGSLLLQFILVGWLSTSWALLFPMIVPEDNAIMATGFYVVISSLLFSGNQSPILYKSKSEVLTELFSYHSCFPSS
jgi:ABC-2 type transporter